MAIGPTTFVATAYRLDVERLLGDDLPQAAVLIFELFQPLHLTQLEAAVMEWKVTEGELLD